MDALKRIERAERELKAAKEALTNNDYEYIIFTEKVCHFKINRIYKVDSYYRHCATVDNIMISDTAFKLSTKEAYEEQNKIIRVPKLKDFDIHIENNTGRNGALVQYLNAMEIYLLSKENN